MSVKVLANFLYFFLANFYPIETVPANGQTLKPPWHAPRVKYQLSWYLTRGACQHDNKPEVLRVIIEVKGNWNKEVRTAMETQICRYLKKNSCRHGLYLIGWFDIKDWHNDPEPRDSRRSQCMTGSSQEAQNYFYEQAHKLAAKHQVWLKTVVFGASLTHQRTKQRKAGQSTKGKTTKAKAVKAKAVKAKAVKAKTNKRETTQNSKRKSLATKAAK